MDLEAGTQLGPYEIVELLGKGGMGEVYKARDTRLGREVAIKILPSGAASNENRLRRFRTEARAASALNHPNIVTIHDVGESDGIHYIVMEYVEGRQLGSVIAKGLSVDQVASYATQIADGLVRAHEVGIIHRDLKPANIVVGINDQIKILDFGLAKLRPLDVDTLASTLEQAATVAGTMVGTLGYMSPEQAKGEAVDVRSDQFSFGAVLFEMATGQSAFRRASPAETLSAILRDRPDLDHMRADLPQGYRAVLTRCLAKAPDERYSSTADLLSALREIETPSGPSTAGAGAGAIAGSQEGPSLGTPGNVEGQSSPVRTKVKWLLGAAAIVAVMFLIRTWLVRSDSQEGVVEVGSAIAALPFVNLTGNEQLSYIGSGLAAGLISELSKIPGLSVVGRSRSWSLLEESQSSAELAETLGVTVLVEGEVHAIGDKLRVDVSATDGVSAVVLWSQSFEGDRDQLYELQGRIVPAVARVLSVPLSRADRRRLARGGPPAQAFDYYLQGLERLDQVGNPRHLEFAADLFRQAIRLEDDFAIFHAALSSAISRRPPGSLAPVDQAESEEEARKALALDAELPEAHLALARALRRGGRFAESIAELRRLLADHPKPDEAFRELAIGYRRAGDMAASAECLETAVALGPENWFNWNALGVFQAVQGEVEAARASLERAVELAPAGMAFPRVNLGGVKMLQRDYAGAIADFEASGAATSNAMLASNMATAYFFQGQLDRAAAMYERAVVLDPESHVLHRNFGDALLGLGRADEARREFSTALRLAEAELASNANDNALLRSRALYTAKAEDCKTAVAYAEAARLLLPTNWQNQLPLAMTFALCERRPEALRAVKLCLDGGFPGPLLRQQPELDSLLEDEEFIRLTQ